MTAREFAAALGWAGFAAWLLFGAQGCVGPEDVFVARHLEGETLDAVQAAADEWCEATDGARCPTLGEGGGSRITGVEYIREEGDWMTLGRCVRYTDDTSRIVILTTLTYEETRITALHEFGHHFGCDDLVGGTIMDPTASNVETAHLTEVDLACAKGR